MTSLRTSIVTLKLRPYADIDAYLAHIEKYVAEAKEKGSDVVLFPELGNVGLLFTDPTAAARDARDMGPAYAEVLTPFYEPFKQGLIELARKYDIVIIGPTFWHKTDGEGRNTAIVALPDGSIYRQDKIHMTRSEQAIMTAGGSQIGTFEVNGIKAGLLICYDSQWPELARPIAEAGAQVLFVPSLTTWRGYWRVRYATQARAQENQMYVCVATIVGELAMPASYPMVCHGRPYVTCPIDNVFAVENGLYAEGPTDQEGIMTVDLDLDLVERSRAKGEIRNVLDRRHDLYPTLTIG